MNFILCELSTCVLLGLPHPFGVAVLEDDVYWSDWHTKSINHVNKLNVGLTETILSQLHYPMDIRVFHPLRQPQCTMYSVFTFLL